MFPKSSPSSALDPKVFLNPPARFRGAPLWSWNCKLDREQLLRQIDAFREMGLGGFHIHPRTGLETPYLGEEFLEMVKACAEKAETDGMYAWLYDEDRWPSGFAGGLVTTDPELRAKYLLFTPVSYAEGGVAETDPSYSSWAMAARNGQGRLLARYEIVLENGCLKHYRLLHEGENASRGGRVWYAYLETMRPSVWYNGQAYADTLNPRAIQKFLEVTHEKYRATIGHYFGNVTPGIFTDEPQLINKTCLRSPEDAQDLVISWTDNFFDTFQAQYGESLEAALPEVFFELPDHQPSRIRYLYHDHLSERFVASFADQVGAWCERNGLMLTGHVMEEPTLRSQTAALGEAMRSYRSFQLPGIDMLCDHFEYTTAKQAQSASRQYGRSGVMSEIYGVTNWDFDFLGHKGAGDWQAALGVNLRVHHLSWVSMAGEAKRDYPASIHYQSPWYREYGLVEDHFARVGSALAWGRPAVRVGVIHPIESYWLCFGPIEQTREERQEREDNFQDLTKWLLSGLVDFDFIAESLLPSLAGTPSEKAFPVGQMAYEIIVVPGLRTIRATTLERLEAFHRAGGRVLFLGEIPSLVDAVPSDRPKHLAERCANLPYSRVPLLRKLRPHRDLEIRLADGKDAGAFLYQLRETEAGARLFICNTLRRQGFDRTTVRIRGEWRITECDTLTAQLKPLPARVANGWTELDWNFPGCGSLLLSLEPGASRALEVPRSLPYEHGSVLLSDPVPVTLSEPNVLLLDLAEWRVNAGPWQEKEEILRLDNLVRRRLGLPDRSGNISQAWTDLSPTPLLGTVDLRYEIELGVPIPPSLLAVEKPSELRLTIDGAPVPAVDSGWWVDEAIRMVPLPALEAGCHEIIMTIPFHRKTELEPCYLLGDFGVELSGRHARITAPVRRLAFGDWTRQGLPFYAGNVTYHCEIQGAGHAAQLSLPKFKAPLVTVELDGQRAFPIAFPPFQSDLGVLSPGRHRLDLTAYGNRINSFGDLHNANEFSIWHGPGEYRTQGEKWSYEYQIKPMGILTAPAVLS